nr:DUF4349 domain-containing protein [uncultured Oscillibacter sp.]
MKRGLALFLAALLTALALTGCGGGGYSGGTDGAPTASESQTAYDTGGGENWKAEVREFGFDAPADDAGPGAAPEEGEGQTENRLANAKMVYTASVEAETQDYDACTAALEELVDKLGGYLEYASADSYGDGSRSASYTVRVPAKEFRGFLKTVGEISHVTSQSRNADNISEMYYDTESRLETQKTKMERLQMLLSKAENMEDIIDLENAISETEYQIEQLTGSLRHYDSLVDFATIDVRLREVLRLTTVEEAPPTFASRLGNAFVDGLHGFGDFLQDVAIYLAYNWTWMILLALIVLLAVKVSKRAQARRGETFRGPGPFQEPRVKREGFFKRKKKDEPKNPDDKQP